MMKDRRKRMILIIEACQAEFIEAHVNSFVSFVMQNTFLRRIAIQSTFLLLSSAFFLTSCETLVNNVPPGRLPSLEEKLVINSFISPQDTLVKVYIGLSSPLFSDFKSVNRGFSIINGDTTFRGESPFIADADVFLKSGSSEVKLAYNSREEFYFIIPSASTLEILPNRKYELRVNYQDKTATAETIIPDMPIINFEVEVDTLTLPQQQFRQGGLEVTSKVTFATQGGGYFRVRGFTDGLGILVENDGTGNFTATLTPETRNIFFINDGLTDSFQDPKTASVQFTGTTLLSPPFISVGGQRLNFDKKPQLNSVYNEAMRINEPYYLYYESIRNYSDNSDNPFVEPTPIYGNIKGGLGIFASSNRIGKRIEFK